MQIYYMAHGIFANGTYPAPSITDERVYCKHESCIELLTDEQATICERCEEPFCEAHIYELISAGAVVRSYCSDCEGAVMDAMDAADWDSGAYRG